MEKRVHLLFKICGFSVIGVLFGIFLFLISESLPTFQELSLKDFFFSFNWNPTSLEKESFGILTLLFDSLMAAIGACLISFPVGVGIAIFLAFQAPEPIRKVLKSFIEILAGIPSVVIGFIGIITLGPFIAKIFHQSNGLNALNGILLLSLMSLPTIISLSEDAIRSVPKEYYQGSLALGSTKWEAISRAVVPAAYSGVLAALMLGMGRAIGETMAVIMACGNAPAFPTSIFDSIRTMTATIAIELGEVAYDTTHYYSLFFIGFVLFLITFAINMASEWILQLGRKHHA